MMDTKQEIKSLPRNRKCGNCRYFEPAPLWRKGWCRNPRLYDRRANHLVDATTIDCEQVFRARIYWEPIPSTDNREAELGYSPFTGVAAADSGELDFSRNRSSTDGVLRSQVPVNNGREVQPAPASSNLPVINRTPQPRERAGATPGLIPRENRLRIWLIENIPYYDRIDGPISRFNLLKVLPWLIVAALVLFLLLNVLGGNKGGSNPTATPGTTSGIVAPLQTTAAVSAPNGKPQLTATPTLSTLVPTQTPVPAPTATPVRTETFARVVKVGKDGLRMRKEPGTGTNIQVLEQIPEGEQVKIRDEQFRTVDGITWWPISYKGKDGWASADYLQKINP